MKMFDRSDKARFFGCLLLIGTVLVTHAADFTCDNLTVNGKLKQGYQTSAGGNLAVAEGWGSSAAGDASHAENAFTTASGWGSHAEGYATWAVSNHSHVEGYYSTASGWGSHAEGCGNTASGYGSHAEGWDSVAAGTNSHAEGKGTRANSYSSHSEGIYTYANGLGSHAEGYYSYVNGNGGHAEGVNTKAYGTSHAEGQETISSNNYSHAEGYRTEALAQGSHAGGSNARVLANHTNAFIHAQGIQDGAKKETLFSNTAHFDCLITLSPANDHSNSVLNRWENDLRYSTTGVVGGVQSQVSQQAGSISNIQTQVGALEGQTSSWNSATAHTLRTDNPHGVTAIQVGALTNNQQNVSLNGGVVAITNQLGEYVRTNHTGNVKLIGNSETVTGSFVQVNAQTMVVQTNALVVAPGGQVGVGTASPDEWFTMSVMGNGLLVSGDAEVDGYLWVSAIEGDGSMLSNLPGGQLQNGSVALAALAANSVNSSKIVDGSIANGDLGTGIISSNKIAANAVTTVHVQNNAITSEKMAAGSVGASQIANGTVSTGKFDSSVDSRYVNIAGDTMTGALALPVNGLAVGASQLVVTASGVGIGTNMPNADLDVMGDANISGGLTVGGISGDGSGLTGITAVQVGAAAANHTHSQYMLTNQVLSHSQYPLALTNETYTGDVTTNANNVYALGTTQRFDAVEALSLVVDDTAFYVTPAGKVGIGTNTLDAGFTVTIDGGLKVGGAVSATSLVGDGTDIVNLDGAAIQAASVPHSALETGAVRSVNIQADAVGTSHLVTNAITTAKLADSAVTGDKLADLSVSEGKLANGAVTATKIGSSAVGETALADGAVSTSKLGQAVFSAFAPANLSGYAGNNIAYSNGQFHAEAGYSDDEATNAIMTAWPNLDTDATDDLKLTEAGHLIVPAGNLGIGTGTPTNTLEVVGNASITTDIHVGGSAVIAGTLMASSIIVPESGDLSMGAFNSQP